MQNPVKSRRDELVSEIALSYPVLVKCKKLVQQLFVI